MLYYCVTYFLRVMCYALLWAFSPFRGNSLGGRHIGQGHILQRSYIVAIFLGVTPMAS